MCLHEAVIDFVDQALIRNEDFVLNIIIGLSLSLHDVDGAVWGWSLFDCTDLPLKKAAVTHTDREESFVIGGQVDLRNGRRVARQVDSYIFSD